MNFAIRVPSLFGSPGVRRHPGPHALRLKPERGPVPAICSSGSRSTSQPAAPPATLSVLSFRALVDFLSKETGKAPFLIELVLDDVTLSSGDVTSSCTFLRFHLKSEKGEIGI
jgi:hypothetical protein